VLSTRPTQAFRSATCAAQIYSALPVLGWPLAKAKANRRERGSLCGSGGPFSENNCVQNYPLQAPGFAALGSGVAASQHMQLGLRTRRFSVFLFNCETE
jgi:hypothetical protein